MKGQSAMEFMTLIGVLLIIFVAMLGIVSSDIAYTNKKKELMIGEDIIIKIQREINLAARALDGYSREFTIPEKLGNKNYSIWVTGNEVIISTANNDFWRVIPTVNGNITKGKNTINKTNGMIYIN